MFDDKVCPTHVIFNLCRFLHKVSENKNEFGAICKVKKISKNMYRVETKAHYYLMFLSYIFLCVFVKLKSGQIIVVQVDSVVILSVKPYLAAPMYGDNKVLN